MCTLCCRTDAFASGVSGLMILVNKGQHVNFGQFLRVNPGLRIMDDHAIHPGPEEPLGVANTVGRKGQKHKVNLFASHLQ